MFEPRHPIQKYTPKCAIAVNKALKSASGKLRGPRRKKPASESKNVVRALVVPRDRVPICMGCCNLPHARPLFGCRTCGLPHSDREAIEHQPFISSSARMALGR